MEKRDPWRRGTHGGDDPGEDVNPAFSRQHPWHLAGRVRYFSSCMESRRSERSPFLFTDPNDHNVERRQLRSSALSNFCITFP